jgi:hypothetical protein
VPLGDLAMKSRLLRHLLALARLTGFLRNTAPGAGRSDGTGLSVSIRLEVAMLLSIIAF